LPITLLTDFGLEDSYAGVIKGVILSLNPQIRIVDLSHEVAPQDIQAAAFILHTAWRYFPAGTVHLIVVDPGVGSKRAGLAVEAEGQMFIAPDNGVLKYIFSSISTHKVYRIEKSEIFLSDVSTTFHGRDIFAPAAAWLASGNKVASLGSRIYDYDRGVIAQAKFDVEKISGEIIYIDHFGNCVTNIPSEKIRNLVGCQAFFNGLFIGKPVQTYEAAFTDSTALINGSHGKVEVCLKNGNAAKLTGLKIGDKVDITWTLQ